MAETEKEKRLEKEKRTDRYISNQREPAKGETETRRTLGHKVCSVIIPGKIRVRKRDTYIA